MTFRKRKKVTRMRGSHTHGYGSKKKHRGSGNRGGFGMAGTGKKADQKKPSIWKQGYFGKHGFKSVKQRKKVVKKIVNIKLINEKLESWVKQGIAKKENDAYKINLKKIGFQKLLSLGKPKHKYILECEEATEKAVSKIESIGGKVIVIKEKSNESKKQENKNQQ